MILVRMEVNLVIIPIPNSFFVITETLIRIKRDIGVHSFPQIELKSYTVGKWKLKEE